MALKGVQISVVVFVTAMSSLIASAARAEDFYKGKQVTIVVGFSAGGTYDATARIISRHLGKYLAGNPTVIVLNMPGAGSLVAAKHLYEVAPKDGTTLAVVTGGIAVQPLMGNPQARYDSRRFNWIGGRSRDVPLCVVWHNVPVDRIEDVTKRDTYVGSVGSGSRTLTYPKALNELLGTRFKIVPGYPGGNEITLAMEKGEVDGYCGWALGSIKTRAPDWIRDRKIKPLVQFALSRAPDLPDVPIASELAPNSSGRQAMEFLEADSVLAWPLLAPPGLPPERVKELRTAFDAMMQDPQLLEDARRETLDVDPVSGTYLQQLVERLYQTPPDVIEILKRVSE